MGIFLDLFAVVIIVSSALIFCAVISLGLLSRNAKERQVAWIMFRIMFKKFRRDLAAIWKRQMTLDDVLNDKFWNDDDEKES